MAESHSLLLVDLRVPDFTCAAATTSSTSTRTIVVLYQDQEEQPSNSSTGTGGRYKLGGVWYKHHLYQREIFPIRWGNDIISEALINFPENVCSFPGKYLGLPLHTRKLRRVDVQPLLDKIGGRLAGWKGKMLSSSGRETLVKCVLTSQTIYHITVFPTQKWLIKQIDRMRRSFLWKGRGT